MPRVFQTRRAGDRPVYPERKIEVLNPIYVIEESIGGGWIPIDHMYLDIDEAKAALLLLQGNYRISLYTRVSENG